MYKDDKKLAKRVYKGDRDAFNAFFDQYYAPVLRYCQRRVDHHDAEEVATESLKQAIRRIETYRAEASLVSWLYAIAHSQLCAHFKRNNKHQQVYSIDDNSAIQAEVEAMSASFHSQPQTVIEQEQRQSLVHLMLDYLPKDYGEILELKYIEGYSVAEIANQLDMSAIAIQSKLARARNHFKKHFASLESTFNQQVMSAENNYE